MAGTDITSLVVDDTGPNTTTPPGPTNNLVQQPQLLIQQPTFLNDIKTAITDAEKVEAGGGVALPPPNNFLAVDLTNATVSTSPGDKFGGTTAGINAQFIKIPTADNWLVQALTPGVFIGTYTGNDVLIANGGRNIMDATSGKDVFIGGSGQDTFLADIRAGASTDTISNFLSGDDLAVVGLTRADFTYFGSDTGSGLQIDAVPKAGGNPVESIVLPGYTVADVNGATPKLTLGASKTPDGLDFVYVHAT